MRHRVAGRQLGRNPSHRNALFRTLVTSVIEKERIETTLAKAKEIRSMVERMITVGKMGDLSARRRAASFIMKRDVVKKLFDTIAPRFKDRNGGYTRIVRTRRRVGDGAEMAVIEILGFGAEKKAEGVKEKKKAVEKKGKKEGKARPEKPTAKVEGVEAKKKGKESKASGKKKGEEKTEQKAKRKSKAEK
ncbi:MAG: 50S ribosomal protein L17 [Nitrospirae bacterium]|nr:50S ribosomal protein L17 [Nitrospirota bacterium]